MSDLHPRLANIKDGGYYGGSCEGPRGIEGTYYSSCDGGPTILRGRRAIYIIGEGAYFGRRLCGRCARAWAADHPVAASPVPETQ